MLEWARDHRTLLYWLAGLSLVVLAASLVVMPIVIVRLPADYFRNLRHRGRAGRRTGGQWLGMALRLGRNMLGWFLILAGLAMLVLPGQGVLVLLTGLMLADFPGKHRLERWIISRGRVLRPINRLRKRFGRPPLEINSSSVSGQGATA